MTIKILKDISHFSEDFLKIWKCTNSFMNKKSEKKYKMEVDRGYSWVIIVAVTLQGVSIYLSYYIYVVSCLSIYYYYIYFYLFGCLQLYMLVFLSIHLSSSIYLSIFFLLFYPTLYLSIYILVFLSISLSLYLHINIYFPIYL